MKNIYKYYLPVLFVFAVICSGCAEQGADLIIHNGKIVTVDKDFSIAEAAAVKDGKFMQVGTEDSVLERAGPDTTIMDLKARRCFPASTIPIAI